MQLSTVAAPLPRLPTPTERDRETGKWRRHELRRLANPTSTAHAPQHYRRGNAIGTGEEPPWWSPELEADQDFPYTIDEWEKDIKERRA